MEELLCKPNVGHKGCQIRLYCRW